LSRAAQTADTAAPQRRCLSTGEERPKDAMVRFVVAPDHAVVPDLAERLPGRGLWVTASREALAKAVSGKAFGRAARGDVNADLTLVDLVERQLVSRAIDLLAMARRASLAMAGFEAVRGALRENAAAVVITASDAAADGVRKIAGPAGRLPWVRALASGEIGLAFGKENVIHAALRPGALTDRFLREARRLEGFRPAEDAFKA